MDRCPAGTQTNSKRLDRFPVKLNKLVWAKDQWVSDTEGKQYYDVISALGAIILGHCDYDVTKAAEQQLLTGHSFSLPTELEEQVAELICGIVPTAEMVRFGKSGHEATMAAVRLARAYTKRNLIVAIKPGYHGCGDWFQALHKSPGVPLPQPVSWRDYNEDFRLPERTAAVILEPVIATDPELPRTGWLQYVRQECDRIGALLIFDEIVTFGRFPHLTAQQYFSVYPDLTCLGKCMGNGLPLSAVCGRRDIMQLLEGEVFFSTTFGGEAVSLAAAKACLEKLTYLDVGHTLWGFGQEVTRRLRDLGLDVYGYPSRPVIRNEPEGFQAAMLEQNVLYAGYFNLTHCMVDEFDIVLEACSNALTACFAG